MPRLFFDEPLSEALCRTLADIFPGSLHIRLLGRGGATDATVWELARQHGCLVVSKDEDFHRLHTTIHRIDAQRRESGEAAKWEQELAEMQKNLQQGPQIGPQADKIVRQREAGNTVTPPRINRLGA